jgi:NAD(P)-dependent dehydrogenase (short-subunit alcohol dehydrogenase family)
MELAGRTLLITGGGSGLGAACVTELHQAGAQLVIADVNVEAGTQLAESLGPCCEFQRTDVTRTDDLVQAMEWAIRHFGGLHGVVQCAGILGAARLAGRTGPHDLDLFRRVVEVNLIGTFNVLRLAAQQMKVNPPTADGERGVIVNTASVAAFEGQIGQIAYAASKGGVASMTLPAARDLAADGIRVVAVAPGAFGTPMIAGAPAKVQESLQQQTVFPARLGQPREFAMLVRHIFENPMLNGSILRLDGAVRMGPR